VNLSRRTVLVVGTGTAVVSIAALTSHVVEPEQQKPVVDPDVIVLGDFGTGDVHSALNVEGSIIGMGKARTVYRMPPRTSDHLAHIRSIDQGQPIGHFLMQSVGTASARLQSPEIAGFTLVGTDQGHDYNGIRTAYADSPHVHDLEIIGIPGTAAGPPGETFSLATYEVRNLLVEDVDIDGRDASGEGVAATLYGLNNTDGATLRRITGHYATYGMGCANWQCTGEIVYEDVDFTNCRHPVNFEQQLGGSIRLTRVDMRGQTDSGPHITVNSNVASVPVLIEDPVIDQWPLRVGVSSADYLEAPQLQKVSDVQLVVGGRQVTADPTYLQCGQVW
jgi:hypothetical protein